MLTLPFAFTSRFEALTVFADDDDDTDVASDLVLHPHFTTTFMFRIGLRGAEDSMVSLTKSEEQNNHPPHTTGRVVLPNNVLYTDRVNTDGKKFYEEHRACQRQESSRAKPCRSQ